MFFDVGWEMGRVESFSASGLDMWFNSHNHVPPHFRARKPGSWEIRVFVLTCAYGNLDFEIKWGGRPSAKEVKQLESAVVRCRAALLEEWEAKVCQ